MNRPDDSAPASDAALMVRKRAEAERLATRRLVCTCECADTECDREWLAPADTEGRRIEFECHRATLRAEPDGRVVCVSRNDAGGVDQGVEPDADDLLRL